MVKFHEINSTEICQVIVRKGHAPLFLEVADKNGQKQEKFYLRSGNTSQELSPSETSEYVSTRFKS